MMIEWSGRIEKVDSRNGFKKDELIYLVMDVDNIDVKPVQLKIQYLQYDANAPYQVGDDTEIICKSIGWFKKRKYKIPFHWVGKTKQEAIKNFFKYRHQFKRSLKSREMKDKNG